LFYLDANGLLTVAPIGLTPGGGFNHGSPTRLVNTAYYNGFTTRGIDLRGYDVSPDGKRFLMIKESATEAQKTGEAAVINVVLNWAEELKSKLPAR
jgi:hypothetical protein